MISGFRRSVHEICAVFGYYEAWLSRNVGEKLPIYAV